jgi:mannosyl-oligosaccharide alpha-1,2-mannosidase
VFLVSAIIITVLLFQVGRNSDWEPPSSIYNKQSSGGQTREQAPLKSTPQKTIPKKTTPEKPSQHDDESAPIKVQEPVKIPELKQDDYGNGYGLPTPPVKKATPSSTPTPKAVKTPAALDIPDRVAAVDKTTSTPATSISTPIIHWSKQSELFPVPTESLIHLPTGTPKVVPRIQFEFPAESEAAKDKREKRLAEVKAEAEKAWSGYKQYAWTHDEVMPVSKKSRDPFCGWAATLVDSLDTLWIMGLKDEFEDATKAVGDIDFTTSAHRSEIPVFETIIRYLGGLLAAYDISGAKYPVLLDKALELAEILMGVFDTPNRMPILYYGWKPAVASQPHRASSSSGVAELGTMSMEFTRLAQLTGQQRFYDAIARITDALEELQNRKKGTALPGIFPQILDASGCNRTAMNIKQAEERSKAAKLQEEEAAKLNEGPPVGFEVSKLPEPVGSDGMTATERRLEKEKADQAAEEMAERAKSSSFTTKDALSKITGEVPEKPNSLAKRDVSGSSGTSNAIAKRNIPGVNKAKEHPRTAPVAASGHPVDFDCPAQGLMPAGYGGSYSMGGSQDSAYEYFPKQYLLLGGLEPKYRTMHEKTVAAVKKYLLFRPMIEDETRDLLFSARAISTDGTDENLSYDFEVTHLSCFLGGMFGLGGKIFDSEEDVEIGKKLTDGCVWAYEIMPTGVMPEYSSAFPCRSVSECNFNETAWHERLDPQHSWREENMADWKVRHAAWEKEVEEIMAAKKEAEDKEAVKDKPTENEMRTEDSEAIVFKKRAVAVDEESTEDTASKINLNDPSGQTSSSTFAPDDQTSLADEYELPAEPIKPKTHAEHVKEKIENERIPKGFVDLKDKRYILR